MVSDTPRTDAFISELRVRHFNECEAPGIAAMHAWKFNEVQEFSRQLERELAEARREADKWANLAAASESVAVKTHLEAEKARSELEEAQRDADDNYRQGVRLGVRYVFKYLNFQAPVDYRIDEMVDAAIKARGA